MTDGLSQRTEDAIVTLLLQRLASHPRYPESYAAIMDGLEPDQRAEVEAAVDRHAERMRAAGEPGW